MRRTLVATAALVAVATLASPPADAARHHVPASVCRTAWHHPTSHTVNQCQRQGWTIEVDYDGYDQLWQVLVIGPHGRVWVDTLGSVEVR